MKKLNTFSINLIITFSLILVNFSMAKAQDYDWTELDTMYYRSAALAACQFNGKIYAIGGTDASMHNGQYGEDYMQIYDIESQTWSLGSPMQYPRMMLGTAQVDGIIYAIGGGFQSYLTNKVEAYNPLTNTWVEKAARPKASSCFGICAVDGKIYTFGGTSSTGVFPSYIYDPVLDAWSDMAAIPHPSGGLSFAEVDGKIYAMGGVDNTFTCISNLQVYDIASNTWEEKQPMLFPRFGSTALALGNKIYVFGGCVFPENIANSILQIYDIETDSWSSKDVLPLPTQWAAVCCSTDNAIYLMGGEDRCMMTYPEEALIYNFLYKLEISWLGINDPFPVDKCSLQITPNPVNNQVTIFYKTIENGPVLIEIFNLTGEKIKTLNNTQEQKGEYSFNWNMEELPAGIYFCSMQFCGKIVTKKFIKL